MQQHAALGTTLRVNFERAMRPNRLLLLLLLFAAIASGSCERGPSRPTPSATVATVDTGRVVVDGGSLYYEAAGSGAPVILLHGGNLDRRMWDAQFALLRQRYRVIRYDARGFGRSSAADRPFAAHDDLAALFRALNLSRAALVGLSMGGRIAISADGCRQLRLLDGDRPPPGSGARGQSAGGGPSAQPTSPRSPPRWGVRYPVHSRRSIRHRRACTAGPTG